MNVYNLGDKIHDKLNIDPGIGVYHIRFQHTKSKSNSNIKLDRSINSKVYAHIKSKILTQNQKAVGSLLIPIIRDMLRNSIDVY